MSAAAGDPRCPRPPCLRPAAASPFLAGGGKTPLALHPPAGWGSPAWPGGRARGPRRDPGTALRRQVVLRGGGCGRRPLGTGGCWGGGRYPREAGKGEERGAGAPPPVGGRWGPGDGRAPAWPRRCPARWRPARPASPHLACPPARLWRLRRLGPAERPDPPAAAPRSSRCHSDKKKKSRIFIRPLLQGLRFDKLVCITA